MFTQIIFPDIQVRIKNANFYSQQVVLVYTFFACFMQKRRKTTR